MSDKSAIEWTDATWNPTTGCTKVSPACANCYIERTPPFRVRGRKFVNGDIPIEFRADRLLGPVRRKKPTTYFVNSLSDLFHDDIPWTFTDRVFAAMALSPHHTFQILTKRAERMRDYMISRSKSADYWKDAARFLGYALEFDGVSLVEFPLENVWLGVSVENQHFADERIPLLLQTPAAVRFLSCEPLLGPLNLSPWVKGPLAAIRGLALDNWLPPLDWIIVGAESGPRVRPTDPAWVRSIRDQCNAAGTAFFFKQWGGRTAKSGGRVLDGRTWDEMPSSVGAVR